jgi:acetyltransferase-like isoleucine patch superfamily enzyme
LVLADVEPYTVVAGSPAKVLKQIPRPDAPATTAADADAGDAGRVGAG